MPPPTARALSLHGVHTLALSRGRKDVSDYLKDIAGVLPFVKSVVVTAVEKRR